MKHLVAPLSCLLVAIGLAAAGIPRRDAVEVVREPRTFIVSDIAGDEYAAHATDVAERAWKLTERLVRAKPPAGKIRPRSIRIFHSEAEWERATAYLGDDVAALRARGLTDVMQRVAFVRLGADVPRAAWGALGRRSWASQIIAHEASHLALADCTAAYDEIPLWLSEGIAIYVDDEVGARRSETNRSVLRSDNPDICVRMLALQRLRREGRLPSARAIMQSSFGSIDRAAQDAVIGEFFRMLMEPPHAQDLAEVLRVACVAVEVGDVPGSLAARVATEIRKSWPDSKMEALDAQFRQRVDALRPEWDASGGYFDAEGDSVAGVGPTEGFATLCRVGSRLASGRAIRGRVTLLSGAPDVPAAVYVVLGRDDARFVCVRIMADTGVTLFRYRGGEDPWLKVTETASYDIRLEREVAFEARWRSDVLQISIDGSALLSVPVEGLDLSGEWGVGVEQNVAAVWGSVHETK